VRLAPLPARQRCAISHIRLSRTAVNQSLARIPESLDSRATQDSLERASKRGYAQLSYRYEFPKDSHVCSLITAKCWEQAYSSATEVLQEIEAVEKANGTEAVQDVEEMSGMPRPSKKRAPREMCRMPSRKQTTRKLCRMLRRMSGMPRPSKKRAPREMCRMPSREQTAQMLCRMSRRQASREMCRVGKNGVSVQLIALHPSFYLLEPFIALRIECFAKA
jgi:hypothetical protein